MIRPRAISVHTVVCGVTIDALLESLRGIARAGDLQLPDGCNIWWHAAAFSYSYT